MKDKTKIKKISSLGSSIKSYYCSKRYLTKRHVTKME